MAAASIIHFQPELSPYFSYWNALCCCQASDDDLSIVAHQIVRMQVLNVSLHQVLSAAAWVAFAV